MRATIWIYSFIILWASVMYCPVAEKVGIILELLVATTPGALGILMAWPFVAVYLVQVKPVATSKYMLTICALMGTRWWGFIVVVH